VSKLHRSASVDWDPKNMWHAIRFFVNHPFAVGGAGSSPLQLAKRELLQLAGRDIQPPYLLGVGFGYQRRDDHVT
jgi:hypothetical protein